MQDPYVFLTPLCFSGPIFCLMDPCSSNARAPHTGEHLFLNTPRFVDPLFLYRAELRRGEGEAGASAESLRMICCSLRGRPTCLTNAESSLTASASARGVRSLLRDEHRRVSHPSSEKKVESARYKKRDPTKNTKQKTAACF